MKYCTRLASTILLMFVVVSFQTKNEIGNCFISFQGTTDLVAAQPERLPENAENFRAVKTDSGEVDITRIDGYRILYNNKKEVPFVNIKVELSAENSYISDQKKLLDNLKFLNAHSGGMETKELIVLTFNGYTITGLSRGTIESGSTLGTFVFFPGNGIVVYFYFNNLKPGYRNFESVEDYKKQRNQFIEAYTKYLLACNGK